MAYPDDWQEIAQAVKEAAGWCCEDCSHPHSFRLRYVLTVHHLDGNPANCDHTNLVALCQRCHLRIQATWRPGQRWLFDPPEWAVKRGWA